MDDLLVVVNAGQSAISRATWEGICQRRLKRYFPSGVFGGSVHHRSDVDTFYRAHTRKMFLRGTPSRRRGPDAYFCFQNKAEEKLSDAYKQNKTDFFPKQVACPFECHGTGKSNDESACRASAAGHALPSPLHWCRG